MGVDEGRELSRGHAVYPASTWTRVPRRVPWRVPHRVPWRVSVKRGTRRGTLEGIFRGRQNRASARNAGPDRPLLRLTARVIARLA